MFARYSRAGILLRYIPLYAGPVLAGAGALTPWTIPAFGLIFTALILHQRPGQNISATVFSVVINSCIAGLLYGVGTAVSWLTGPLEFPMWAALGMSAIGAAWIAVRFPNNPEMDALLDTALETVTDPARGMPDITPWTEVIHETAAPPERLLDALETGRQVRSTDLPTILDALNRKPAARVARDVSRHADFSDNGLIVALAWFAQPLVADDLVSDAELNDLLEMALTAGFVDQARPLLDRFAPRLDDELVARLRA